MDIKKSIFQWTAAIVIGFFIVNLLCFGYERPTGWIETPNGPSPAGWNPNTILVHGTEGFGVIKTDENGYINIPGSLQEKYVLCMGSSHTQAKEMSVDENFTSLISAHFSEGEGSLAAYNIACDGNFLPSLIKHFPAAIQAFPDASVVTIEVSSVDFSADELNGALQQVEYDESQNVKNQIEYIGIKDKLKIFIKEYFPLVSLVKSKLETASANDGANIVNKNNDDAAIALGKALKFMRSEYDGEIIFIYHSQTLIEEDGSISFADDKLFEAFEKACSENNICLLDMRPIFLEHYENEKEIPYGFANTKPGNGHLNKLGHCLIANSLIPYIEEVIA